MLRARPSPLLFGFHVKYKRRKLAQCCPQVHRPLRMMSGAQQDSSRAAFEIWTSGGPRFAFIELMRSTSVILKCPSKRRTQKGGSYVVQVGMALDMASATPLPLLPSPLLLPHPPPPPPPSPPSRSQRSFGVGRSVTRCSERRLSQFSAYHEQARREIVRTGSKRCARRRSQCCLYHV